MCLAIYKPAGVIVGRKKLAAGFENNPDGAGFGFISKEDGKLYYVKGLFTFEAFMASYRKYVHDDVQAIIHFRWATVGGKTEENTHPFNIGGGGLMIHNGPQIADLGDKKGDRSDSRVFADEIIAGLNCDELEKMRPLVEGYLERNKVVCLFPDGRHLIFNEQGGHWKDGAWYSNDGYIAWDYSKYSSKRNAKGQFTGAGSLSAFVDFEFQHQSAKERESETFEAMLDRLKRLSDKPDHDPPTVEQLRAKCPEPSYIDNYVDTDDWIYSKDMDQFFFLDIRVGNYVEFDGGYTFDEAMDFYGLADFDDDNEQVAIADLPLLEQERIWDLYDKLDRDGWEGYGDLNPTDRALLTLAYEEDKRVNMRREPTPPPKSKVVNVGVNFYDLDLDEQQRIWTLYEELSATNWVGYDTCSDKDKDLLSEALLLRSEARRSLDETGGSLAKTPLALEVTTH